MKMDLEYFCPKGREKRNWTKKFLSKKAKGRKGVGLRIICASKKREGE